MLMINHLKKTICFWVILSVSSFELEAQDKISVSVLVLDSLTKQPVELAYVRIINPKKQFNTRQDGLTKSFIIEASSSLNIEVKHLNFYRFSNQYILKNDTTITIFLRPHYQILNEVIVTNNREIESVTNNKMSVVKLTPKQIENIPSLAGEKDIIKALALTPGVKTETEGSSSFNVRGGGADQNLLLLNNVTLYSSNHLFGLLSSFNTDIVKEVSLLKGAFPAQYGGRLSSVLAVTTREGDFKHFQVKGTIGLITSRLMLDGPIIKDKLSFIISARRTYIDLLFPATPNAKNPTPIFDFYDINAKIAWKPNKRNKLSLFLYSDRDRIYSLADQDSVHIQDFRLAWRNNIVSLNWEKYINQKYNLISQWSLSDYQMNIFSRKVLDKEDITNDFQTSIKDYTWKFVIDKHADMREMKLGFNYTFRQFNPGYLTFYSAPEKLSLDYSLAKSNISELSLFTENQLKFGTRWNTNLGFRFTGYQGGDKIYLSPEPRLVFGYQISDISSFKGSYTRMQQAVHLLSNPGLGIPIDLWIPANNQIAPQVSNQVTMGYFSVHRLGKSTLNFSAETYYKDMSGIITYRDGKSSSDIVNYSDNNQWQTLVTTGKGKAYGLELFLEKRNGRLTGWAAYTLSWVKQQFNEINGGNEFYPRFDRRHDFSLVLSYKINSKWSVNGSWTYATGQAITLPLQAYKEPFFSFINTSIPINSSTIIYSQGERNAFRMIPFHRLNLSLQRTSTHKWGQGKLELGLYNAYDRKNPYYYFLDANNGKVTLKSMSIFPVLPSVSYSFTIN